MTRNGDPMQSVDHTFQEGELTEALPHLTSFIVDSKIIHLAQFSSDGTIRFINNTMAASLKMPQEVIVGLSRFKPTAGAHPRLLSPRRLGCAAPEPASRGRGVMPNGR